MGKIVILDDQTANQIAAGEVVEGPASVVKELVENAVDAGAAQVQVEIRSGGVKLIRVTDNGSGMERDDVELAFERHATSKIRKIADLDAIRSMGFRGEALASIASVSRLEMLTRTADSAIGVKVAVEGGRILSVEDAGCPVGTTFLVRDLFFNTPARYKFLKKDATEGARVADVLERLALAHPDVSIQFRANNETVLHTPGNGDLASTVYSLYGKETANSMLRLSHAREGISVSGFVGLPAIARGNRARQTVLMNGRFIQNRTVTAALDEAFKTLLMTRQFAFAVLVLDIPPMRVDVNVHPAKLEVRFSEEGAVFSAVHGAVRNALMACSLIGELVLPEFNGNGDQPSSYVAGSAAMAVSTDTQPMTAPGQAGSADAQPVIAPGWASPADTQPMTAHGRVNPADEGGMKQQQHFGSNSSLPSNVGEHTGSWGAEPAAGRHSAPESKDFAGSPLRTAESPLRTAESPLQVSEPPLQTAEPPLQVSEPLLQTAEPPLRAAELQPEILIGRPQDFPIEGVHARVRHPAFLEMRIVGQIFDSYLILQHQDEMLLLDQHAAHERIRFEDLKWSLASGTVNSQQLMQPIRLEMSALEYDQAVLSIEDLQRIGFELETFGKGTLLVRAIPSTFDGGLSETDLISILADWPMEANRRQGGISEELLHRISCKGAIKSGRVMGGVEIRALLDRLSNLENPYTCVHGRPILLRFSRKELEKRFKRIV